MLLNELVQREARHLDRTLSKLAPIATTEGFKRKLSLSLKVLEDWRAMVTTPAVSCGGGKDSTVILDLARQVDPGIPAYRADPPNPLPDRPAHVAALKVAAGGDWRIVPYPWDVEGVLAGRENYPALLKIKRLRERFELDGIDGVVLGLRADESKGRMWLKRKHGWIYSSGQLTCCSPILHWTAEEVVAYTLVRDRLPLNPVYRKLLGAPPLRYLRDGTWFPREVADARGYREWLLRHYPEVIDAYDRAARVMGVAG